MKRVLCPFTRLAMATTIGEAPLHRPDLGPCYEWQRALDDRGYGVIVVGGRKYKVHRFARAAFVGPFDVALDLDHLCRNRRCWRPDHLEPVTGKVNTLRGESFAAVNARMVECTRGHALDAANVRMELGGRRRCLTCEREKRARYKQRKSA